MAVYGSNQYFFEPVSAVTTSPGTDLGTQRIDQGNEFVYVYNGGGADISTGRGCVLATGVSGYTVTVSSVSTVDVMFGVVKYNTLTTGAYGWLQKRGFGSVVMASADSAIVGGNLCAAGNGLFRQITSGASSPLPGVPVARALTEAASAASDVGAYIFCP